MGFDIVEGEHGEVFGEAGTGAGEHVEPDRGGVVPFFPVENIHLLNYYLLIIVEDKSFSV